MFTKLYSRATIIFIFACFSALCAYAQPSGWVVKGGYLQQGLKIPKLNSIAFSPSSPVFYTLHNNTNAYYWDLNSGYLVDSLVIPVAGYQWRFSDDNKSIIGYSPIKIIDSSMTSEIEIIDLETKAVVSKASINLTEDIDCNFPEIKKYLKEIPNSFQDIKFSIINFNSAYNRIELGLEFYYSRTTYDGPEHILSSSNHLGGLSAFNVTQGNYIIEKKLFKNVVWGLVNVDNYYYSALYKGSIYQNTVKNSQDRVDVERIYIFGKLNSANGDTNTIKTEKFTAGSELIKNSQYSSWSKGSSSPYTTLSYDKKSNRIFMKADSIYYAFDLSTDKEIDTFMLPSGSAFEKFDTAYEKIIYYNNNIIYSKSIAADTIIASIYCPISPNTLSIIPSSNKVAITDKAGNIIVYRKFNSIPLSQERSVITLSPNPATSVINFPEEEIPNVETNIYSYFGAKVYSGNNVGPQINIEFLPPGLYFLNCGNKFYKFVKI